MKGQRTRTN